MGLRDKAKFIAEKHQTVTKKLGDGFDAVLERYAKLEPKLDPMLQSLSTQLADQEGAASDVEGAVKEVERILNSPTDGAKNGANSGNSNQTNQ